jgi:protein O-mannosyl-transferase
MLNLSRKNKLKIALAVGLLCVVIVTVFLPSLANGFVNWDDDGYVIANRFIQKLSPSNLKGIFSSFFIGNYQPVTILSYLLDYCLFGPQPFSYHFTNLILHILNAVLLFWLIYLLSKRISIALISALLFGIHPLHVESVAWISARKDLLYSFFFLAALVSYVYYARLAKIGKYYYFSLVLFLFSLLSKAMALVLPLILLSLDLFIAKKPQKNILSDKVPFFALAFIFGIVGITAQYASGAVRTQDAAHLFANFPAAIYSIIFYLNKIFMPVNLACCYPRAGYHFSMREAVLPSIYLIACIRLSLFKVYRNKIIFGNAFFLICALPVLQLIPIGETIVADRYMYLAPVGIFYLLAESATWLYQTINKYKRAIKTVVTGLFICLSVTLSLLTYRRCLVWKDSLSLWSDVIAKYPNAAMAYYNRALAWNSRKNYAQAITDFNRVLSLVSSADARPVYLYLISLYRITGQGEEAERLIDQVRVIDAGLTRQYYQNGNQLREAGKFKEAAVLYKKGLELYPDNLVLINELALTYIYTSRPKDAIALFKKGLIIRPDFALLHNNLALAYFYDQDYALAVEHADRAGKLGYSVVPAFLELLKPYRK